VNTPQIAAFARLAKENTVPVRALEGQKTMISRTMHSLAYDSVHDEIVVNSPLAQAILFFRGGANGEEAPLRVIQGPHTQIQGTDYDGNDKMTFDEVHGEIIIPVAGNKVLVFSREANGDAAPVRVVAGPDTQIRGSVRGHALVGVDPINNLLIVGSTGGQGGGRDGDGEGGRGRGALLIFDRTANGNTKPKAVIQGPNTGFGGVGQIQTYPQKGWIIAGATGGGIGAWSIHDSGDAPPRWKIPVRQITGVAPSGVALDPSHKEVIIASGARNVLLTFSWPEIFD
jgi:hypothetical protein